MEHEYTINGRIFPELSQVQDPATFQQFVNKIKWAEEDFKDTGLKINFTPCDLDEKGEPQKVLLMFSMNSADVPAGILENLGQSLSIIFGCELMLCKDHEVYGVANVFNGGSDYCVVDEDCFLWIFKQGAKLHYEKTKFWNEKFADREREFLNGEVAIQMFRTLLSLA